MYMCILYVHVHTVCKVPGIITLGNLIVYTYVHTVICNVHTTLYMLTMSGCYFNLRLEVDMASHLLDRYNTDQNNETGEVVRCTLYVCPVTRDCTDPIKRPCSGSTPSSGEVPEGTSNEFPLAWTNGDVLCIILGTDMREGSMSNKEN